MRFKTLVALLAVTFMLPTAMVGANLFSDSVTPAGAAVSGSVWSGPLVPDSGVLFGSWIRRDYTSQTAIKNAITTREADLGRKLEIDQHFYGFTNTFPSWREPWDIANGRTPFIAWNGTNTWEVVRGDHDALIRERARAVKALGAPVFLRYMWEPLAKTSMIGSPAEYRDAWRHIRAIFDAEGASNVTWAWCGTGWGMRPGGPEFEYYPGDDVADWVCTDGYNWAPGRANDLWRDWTWIMQGTHDFAVAHNKPVMIAEFGVQERDAGEKAAWMRNAQSAIKTSFPNVKAIVYFDENRLYDWRVDSTPESYAAFKDWANDPYFKAKPRGVVAPTTTTTVAPTTTTTVAPNPVINPLPVIETLFSDGFESGTLTGWEHSNRANATKTRASAGNWSLAASTTTGRAWARHSFPARTSVSGRSKVYIGSPIPTSTVPLIGLKTSSGATIMRVIRASNGRIGTLHGATGSQKFSTKTISNNAWHDVRITVKIAGTSSTVRVFLDGVEVADIALNGVNLGTSPAASVELGDVGGQSSAKAYSIFFDSVLVTNP